jgi:membrane protein DedA with SNARE-associated domain
MEHLTAEVLAFISSHPELAALVIGLTAFCESFAFLSFLFPGFAILVAAGTLVQAGVIDPVSAAIAGAAGALAGDVISYFLGRRAAQSMTGWRFFAKHADAFARGETFFRRYGMASVFIGRFFGPLRAFLPLIAGMCRMKFAAFFTISTLSAAIWSPSLLLSGYLIGALAQSGWSIEVKALIAGAILAAFAGVVWLARKAFKLD